MRSAKQRRKVPAKKAIAKQWRKTPAKKAIAPAVIIVIDDDVLVAESLRGMLESHQWKVEVYESAEVFLKAYRPGYGDCFLIDMNLPGASGIDVLNRLQRDGSQVPSIMITGAGDVETAVEAMKAGAIMRKDVIGSAQHAGCLAENEG